MSDTDKRTIEPADIQKKNTILSSDLVPRADLPACIPLPKTQLKPPEHFRADPRIQEQYALLQSLGVFPYIDSIWKELESYKRLFTGALDIFHCTSIDAILDTAVSQLSHRTQLSLVVFIWKPFQNKDEIIIRGYEHHKPLEGALYLDNIALFEVFFQQHPEPLTYAELLSRMGANGATQALARVDPELIIPILGPCGFYGLILVGRKLQGEGFMEEELTFIRELMSFVSLAIQNRLHYDHSLQDVKTGLYNYGFFMTRLEEEISRVRRNGYVSSVIVIDVDFFKHFNDTYGHIAGDQVLEHIAFQIKSGVRLEDVPSRFGGEEFTVLLPDTNGESAWYVAERLRIAIAQLTVPWEIPLPNVTVSIGIFTFDAHMNIMATEILNRADKALYASKSRGRNCTTLWEPGLTFSTYR
ncbi:MAG: sensor domain-containing diguanylate cyclase [Treponema sp.]|jgi:diguanylate cyclase (GGDEF)-like protein|nr:sensor domain-containing diguanylate cyclase [Treponema sp.]